MNRNERRTAPRVDLRIALRFRPISTPPTPEQKAESLNLSRRGVYFATNFPLRVGMPVELFLKMPREITDQAAIETRCTGHVVHVQPASSIDGKAGVGVHIEHFEALASKERWAS